MQWSDGEKSSVKDCTLANLNVTLGLMVLSGVSGSDLVWLMAQIMSAEYVGVILVWTECT